MASQELSMIINMMKSFAPKTEPTIAEMRAGMESMALMAQIPADVKREPVDAGGVPAEWVTAPGVDARRVILYLHGGGYTIGSINTHRELAARLSRAAAARVLLLGYRLAPEHPHPAAVEDATAAYRWLLAQGVQASRLIVAGDSAGGGLTVATLVALRDAGAPPPAAGVCLSPWVDLEGTGESMTTKAAADPMVQRDGLLKMAAAYLAGQDPRTPLAAPLYANLSGLPPLLIQVGTAETLLDDATRLAERARKAGVDVTLDTWDDMIHVFQAFGTFLPEARQAIDRIGEFVKQRVTA
ncbi:MAG TPA: alpha/beta hydrolase [Candidatus Acidoferrales bacterium]|nr:alpha/beta hydrolase [Candidatus Acidoferrales bacterium]